MFSMVMSTDGLLTAQLVQLVVLETIRSKPHLLLFSFASVPQYFLADLKRNLVCLLETYRAPAAMLDLI